MKQIEKDIAEKKLKNIYLLYGTERYLIDKYCNMLRSSAVDKDSEDMNFTRIEGKKATAEEIEGALDTAPFFSEYRFLHVKDSGLFSPGRKEESQKLAEYLSKIPDESIVVFTEESADKRGSLYKAAAKYGYCTEINGLSDGELSNWLSGLLEKKAAQAEIDHLIQCVGKDMSQLIGEADKLRSYCAGRRITIEDIDLVCTKSTEANVFEMIAAIGKKDPATALDIYNTLIIKKESPLGILKLIARQFRLILECKYLAKRGSTRGDIAQRLKIRDFAVTNYLKQAENFGMRQLLEALKKCTVCDTSIKQGLMNDKLAVEMIILEYSQK